MFVEIVYKDEAEMLEKIKDFLSKNKEDYQIAMDENSLGLELVDFYDKGYVTGDVLSVKMINKTHISIIAIYGQIEHVFLKCIKALDGELYDKIRMGLFNKFKELGLEIADYLM